MTVFGGDTAGLLLNEARRLRHGSGALAGAIRLDVRIALERDLIGDDLRAAVAGVVATGEIHRLFRHIDGALDVHRRATVEVVVRAGRCSPVLEERKPGHVAARWR